VVSVLAVGLGIAVAVTAFAPTAPTSLPGAALVGIHEANYDVEGENQSPLTWYFRVHTGIELRDAEEFDRVAELITGSEYDGLVEYLLRYHGYKIKDLRADSILQAIRHRPQEGDSHELRLALGTQWQGESGYWFHVSMRFDIPRKEPAPPDLHKVLIRHLQEGDLGSIHGTLIEWREERLVTITGDRPLAILAQVKRPEPPPMHDPGR
jgi:hypothetical protein